jgi:hypothetical protein
VITVKVRTQTIYRNAGDRVRAMEFIVTLNNISVISWRSIFIGGEAGVPGEDHPPAVSH